MADITLKSGRDKAVRNRHPWIYSGAIDRIAGTPDDGDVVQETYTTLAGRSGENGESGFSYDTA